MKKFYAFAAAAFMALAANAQNGEPLYATGAGNFANGEWNAETPDEFKFADGVYTLKIGGLTQLKISTACGSWDAFNEGVLGCAYGDEQGVAVPLEAGYTENINAPWMATYEITVAGDLSTITLSTQKPKPDPNALPVVYLRGDMNGWGNDWFEGDDKLVKEDEKANAESWQLEALSKTVFKFECKGEQAIKVGETFKIADNAWYQYNIGGDGETILLDTDTQIYANGDNLSLEEEFTGVMYLNLDVEGDVYIFFSNDKNVDVPDWAVVEDNAVSTIAADNNVAPKYFNLQGVQVANPENGLFIVVKGDKASKVLVK